LRGAKVADEHYTQRAEQGQHWKGAVEEAIGKAEDQVSTPEGTCIGGPE
jgi:hypothetical protein